jgi:hypothetical protein
VGKAAAAVAVALVLLAPGHAHASDASLRAALATWSLRLGHDARGIGLSAINRHPRRLTARALRFRADARHAEHALSSIPTSSARGRHAKQLALSAVRQYALVGTLWALAGRARVAHHLITATKDARLAAAHAKRGDTQLLAASRVLHR